MKLKLLCALCSLANGKSFLWYMLSCHSVFLEVFCTFTRAYTIDVFVWVRFCFTLYLKKSFSESLHAKCGRLPDWCKIFISVFDVGNKELT